MAFLVASNKVTNVVSATPYRICEPSLSDQRKLMENAYPGRRLWSPMERHGRGIKSESVVVYVSPNRLGQGRIGSSLWTWAVESEESHEPATRD